MVWTHHTLYTLLLKLLVELHDADQSKLTEAMFCWESRRDLAVHGRRVARAVFPAGRRALRHASATMGRLRNFFRSHVSPPGCPCRLTDAPPDLIERFAEVAVGLHEMIQQLR